MDQIRRLPGMRDLTHGPSSRLREADGALCAFLETCGYGRLDTPMLEPAELFVRKSGGEFISRTYTFTDPGGHQVSLRPEFTSSVIRHYVSGCSPAAAPARWYYSGPVFRYNPDDANGYRQFSQVGAELVGCGGGVGADAEIVSLAWSGLRALGIGGVEVRLGNVGILGQLLRGCGLTESAALFAMGAAEDVGSGRVGVEGLLERAEELGLVEAVEGRRRDPLASGAGEATAMRELVERLLNEATFAGAGRRTPQQVVSRLLRKAQRENDRGGMRKALALLGELGALRGPCGAVLADARRLVAARGLSPEPLAGSESMVAELETRGVEPSAVVVDLGLAPGIAYYTGVVFQLVARGARGPAVLGAGGRYDGLVKALGGAADVPALGFAYNLDAVVEARDAQAPASDGDGP